MADNKNPEIKIDVTANVEDTKRPLESLVELVKTNEKAVSTNNKALDEAKGVQEQVQQVARGLIEAAEQIGDPTLAQYVKGLFAGGIENAAQMVQKIKDAQRENELLSKIQDKVLMSLNQQTIPSGGGVEEQAAGALSAMRGFSGRFNAAGNEVKSIQANIEAAKNAKPMLNLLNLLIQVNAELRNTHQNAKLGKEDAEQRAEALRLEAEALDASLPGYAKKRAELLQEAAAYDRVAAAQEAVRQGAEARLKEVEQVVKLAGDGRMEEALPMLQRGERASETLAGRERSVDNATIQMEANKAAKAEDERAKAAKEAAAAEEKLEKERARARVEAMKRREEEILLNKEMEFSAMTRQQLARVLARLTKERQAAAAVKDDAKYQRLGQYIMAANRQMERMTRQLQMNKIAGTQQVQMAQSMAASIGQMGGELVNFKENVEEGALSVSGMASAAIGLGQAIQTGMGPIGWAMLALEALVAAWNFFAQKRAEDEKRMREEAKQLAEAQREAREEMETLWKKDAEKTSDMYSDLYKKSEEYYARERDERLQMLEDRRRGEEEAHRHRLAMLELELKSAKGKDKERLKEKIEAEKKAADDSALMEQKQRADIAEAFADELEGNLEKRRKEMGNLLTAWLPDIEAVQDRATKLMADSRKVVRLSEGQRLEMESQQRTAREQMTNILRIVREVDKDFKGSAEDAVVWATRLRQTHEEQEKLLESTRAQVRTAREALEHSRKVTANKQAEAARGAELKDAQDAQVKAERRLAEILNKRVSRQYEPKERRQQDEVFAADKRILQQKLAAVDGEIKKRRAEGADNTELLDLRKRKKELQRQLIGLEEARVTETRRGIEALRKFQAQDMTGPTKKRDKKADKLSEKYARLVEKAQRAMDKGQSEVVRKYMRSMNKLARRIDKLTGDEQGTDMNRVVRGQLQLQLDSEKRATNAKRRKAAAAERAADNEVSSVNKAAKDSTELKRTVEALRQENGQLVQFLGSTTAAMREVLTLCTNMKAEIARHRVELDSLRGKVRSLQTGQRSIAR